MQRPRQLGGGQEKPRPANQAILKFSSITILLAPLALLVMLSFMASAQSTDRPVLVQDVPAKDVVPGALAKPGFDPKSLIGQWQGQWSTPYGQHIYLTITSIEGGKAQGIVHITGPLGHPSPILNRDVAITEGTLDGMHLSFEVHWPNSDRKVVFTLLRSQAAWRSTPDPGAEPASGKIKELVAGRQAPLPPIL